VSTKDELLLVVDEHDRPIEPLPRRIVHTSGAWHRVVHIWVVNGSGEILCQQRSLAKDLNPGWWEACFGGHVVPGEEYLGAALRELREELGLAVRPAELKFWKVYQHRSVRHANNEFQAVFVLRWGGDPSLLTFSDGEVEQVAWKPAAEVRERIASHAAQWVGVSYEPELIDEMGWVKA